MANGLSAAAWAQVRGRRCVLFRFITPTSNALQVEAL